MKDVRLFVSCYWYIGIGYNHKMCYKYTKKSFVIGGIAIIQQ